LHAREGLFGLFSKIVGGFGGLIIPIFLIGMFSRRVGSLGVCLGAISGLAATYYWAFGTNLGYGWTPCVAFVVIIVVSYGVSLVEPAPPPHKLAWRWNRIMARPEEGQEVERGLPI
jgi:Na+/proline symporter